MLYNIKIFYLSLLFYFLSAYSLVRKSFPYLKRWLLLASVCGGLYFVARYKESSNLALVSLFEITFFYAWLMGILYVILVKHELPKIIQGIFLFLIYAILLWGLFLDKSISLLNPALRSHWLLIHVPSAILSYGTFTFSFAISLYYIAARKKAVSLNYLAAFNFRLIIFGVILLGICIVTGAIWAKQAWGRFWSGDPKETWALFTFIIYAMIIPARKILKLSPLGQAVISIIGFTAMLATFFGVNLLFNSHHAY